VHRDAEVPDVSHLGVPETGAVALEPPDPDA